MLSHKKHWLEMGEETPSNIKYLHGCSAVRIGRVRCRIIVATTGLKRLHVVFFYKHDVYKHVQAQVW